MDYISAFSNLKTNNKYARKSPHKAILLLTVIEMFEKGLISENEIRYDDALIDTFQSVWNKVLPEETTFYTNVYFPFWYLHSEEFWHNVPFRNREDSFKNIWDNKIKPTESKVKEIIQYAELDEDLYFLMTMPSGRSSLKRVLLETYTTLSDRAIEQFSASEDNSVDHSIAAMNDYQAFLDNAGSASNSTTKRVGSEDAESAFAELSDDLQIALSLEYYKFLKSQPLERTSFRELFPTTADLYYHIKYKPYKRCDVDFSLQSVLVNFLFDLRITMMSEDGAMSFIDSINDAIHALQDSVSVTIDEEEHSYDEPVEEVVDNVPSPEPISESTEDVYRQDDPSRVYHYSASASEELSVDERIARLRRELEASDKKEYGVREEPVPVPSEKEEYAARRRFNYLHGMFATGESRRGVSWSQDEEEYVTLCFKKGETPDQIAEKLGRTYNAIMARLSMLRLIDDYSAPTPSTAPQKTELNMSSDRVPSGYTVDNLGSSCYVRNERGERVFSDSGSLVIVNGKIYRFKVQKVCLTMKAVVYKDGQWRKSGKMLVAFSSSMLYKILSRFDFINEIEDIVEGDTIYRNKIKVRGHWFDYNGDVI